MQEKKKFKFNLIDVIVVVVLLAAIGFGAFKLFVEPNSIENTQETTYRISFYCEEVPSFAANAMKIGDPVSDELKDVPLGTVIEEPVIEPSVAYAATEDGTWVMSSKEGYNSVKVTAEVTVKGEPYKHGIQINESKYGVGHTLAFRVGKAKIYGRVSGIEIVK